MQSEIESIGRGIGTHGNASRDSLAGELELMGMQSEIESIGRGIGT